MGRRSKRFSAYDGLTAREEKFARLIALKDMTDLEAYTEAYDPRDAKPATTRRNAKALRLSEPVAKRIEKIQSDAYKEALLVAALDKNWVLSRFMDNAETAIENGDISASNTALTKLGEHLGVFRDNPIAESIRGFFEVMAGNKELPASGEVSDAGSSKVVEGEVRVIE